MNIRDGVLAIFAAANAVTQRTTISSDHVFSPNPDLFCYGVGRGTLWMEVNHETAGMRKGEEGLPLFPFKAPDSLEDLDIPSLWWKT